MANARMFLIWRGRSHSTDEVRSVVAQVKTQCDLLSTVPSCHEGRTAELTRRY